MVQLEEVEDEEFDRVQLGEKDFNEDDDDFTDTGTPESFDISLVLSRPAILSLLTSVKSTLTLTLLPAFASTKLSICPCTEVIT